MFAKLVQKVVAFLYYEWNWVWLRYLLCSLCELEMKLPLLFDSEFVELINRANIRLIHPIKEEKTPAEMLIPKDPLYCDCCPFSGYSKLANFFFGFQQSGYCYYLAKGDFSFIAPTDLLWDGCKECQVNNDFDDDYFATNELEENLDL